MTIILIQLTTRSNLKSKNKVIAKLFRKDKVIKFGL